LKIASLAVALALSLAAAPALADPPTIAVIGRAGGERLAMRLAAELRASGYQTVESDSGVEPADALAIVEGDPPRVRVCVRGDCEELSDSEPTIVLIRAVEALRARLAHTISASAAAAEAEAGQPGTPPAPAVEPESPEHTVWELALAASFGIPTSSATLAIGADLALAWAPDPWGGVMLHGSLGALDAEVTDAAGRASISPRVIGLEGHLRIPESVLAGHHLWIGAGVALVSADVRASAEPPFAARSASVVAAMITVSTALAIRLVDRLALWLSARVGYAIPTPVVVFADREVARWGAPLVALAAGVAIAIDP
jgi:hypothetical protein